MKEYHIAHHVVRIDEWIVDGVDIKTPSQRYPAGGM